MENLPPVFLERLTRIVPPEHHQNILDGFDRPAPYVLRLNTAKVSLAGGKDLLEKAGLSFRCVPWLDAAFIFSENLQSHPEIQDFLSQGIFYKQSLSSMLPPLVLDPQPGEYVLDLCAAPGSKTSQMAGMMNSEGTIIAVESVRSRYYKLQSVLKQLGVTMVQTKFADGRRFRNVRLFDKILVDAPCSSEGRFKNDNPESYAYWSPRKIKEMMQKQRGLLLNASRLLRPGGSLVYSTCTFAPEENEGVIDWLLKKTDGALKVEEISFTDVKTYPCVLKWEKKSYSEEVAQGFRVLPTKDMEGFFITKLTKN